MNTCSSKSYKLSLLTILLIACSLGASAQLHKNYNEVVNKKFVEKAKLNLAERESVLKQHNIVKTYSSRPSNKIRSGSLNVKRGQNAFLNEPQKSANLYSVPDIFLGTFQVKGISYWSGGYFYGETVITADPTTQNKIWIENLIPGTSNQKVYGTVSSDQTKVTIPQGQVIFKEDSIEIKLAVYNSLSAITGKFETTKGLLTIDTDLWGAKATDGWIELFSGSVTYTRLDMLPPVAAYQQPQGGIFLGMIPDTWDSYNNSCIISSPYVTWNWSNNELDEEVNYEWSYVDLMTENESTSDKDSLVMDVEDGFYMTPTLKATNSKGHTSSSTLGTDYKNKGNDCYSVAGGNAVWLGFDEKCDYSSANSDNGFTLLLDGDDAYYFGTGASKFADSDCESLLMLYNKPQTPLYFEGVNVYLFVLDAPETTPLTMNIFKVEKNEEGFSKKGALIASSTILVKNATTISYDDQVVGYTLQFTNFESKDEDGFVIEKEYFEMEEDFYLELTGFNVEGVSLAVASEEVNPTDGESRSLFTVKNDESVYFWDNNRQSMYFNLSNAAFSYITFNKDMVYDDRSGGTYTFEAIPYFDTLFIAEQALPDWLDVKIVSENYTSENWSANVQVTIDALPENEPERYYDLALQTVGATNTILINQGGPVSSNNLSKTQSVSAHKNAEGYLVGYPDYLKEMSVFSLTGSLYGKYDLPVGGQFQFSDSGLPNGLYLLKFSGQNRSEVIKISK